jgi:quinolinate synthase
MGHRLSKECPGKEFFFVEHAICSVMKMTSLSSVLAALETMSPEVSIDKDTMESAKEPLRKMIGMK